MSLSKPSILLDRAVAIGLVLPLTILATPEQAKWGYIILGHAHTVCCHVGQIRSPNYRHTPRWFLYYFLTLAFVVATLYSVGSAIFIGLTASIFIIHAIMSDLLLCDEKYEYKRLISGIPMFVIMLHILFGHFTSLETAQIAYPLAALGIAAHLIYFIYKWKLPSLHTTSMLIIGSVLLGIHLLNIYISPLNIMFFYVGAHVSNWYIKIGEKQLRRSREDLHSYIHDIVYINFFMTFLALVAANLGPEHIFYRSFFTIHGFGVWVMMHIASTMRPESYRLLDSLIPRLPRLKRTA